MARASVAGIRTFIEESMSGTVHAGVDVHKRRCSVDLLRSDGARKEWPPSSGPKRASLDSMKNEALEKISEGSWCNIPLWETA